MVLLAHFHALASFVFGSGINPEPDGENANTFQQMGVSNVCSCDLANDNSLEEVPFSSPVLGVRRHTAQRRTPLPRPSPVLPERARVS